MSETEPSSSPPSGPDATGPSADQQASERQNAAPVADDDPLSTTDAPTPSGDGPEVELVLETAADDLALAPWLGDQLRRLAGLAGVRTGAVTLLVVGDERMAELHGAYYGDGSTTDVLSFDLRDAADGPVEGDLVLCLDEARRQAARRGHAVRLELLLYAVHGLLHLLGWDDQAPASHAAMHQREDELLVRAGFGAVYGVGVPADG